MVRMFNAPLIRKLISVGFALFLIFPFVKRSNAQETWRWDVVDTSNLQYERGTVFGAAAPNDVAMIGEVTQPKFDRVVRRSIDSGKTWSIMYHEPVAWNRWTGLFHPASNVYVVAGDSEHYFGSDVNGNYLQSYQAFLLVSRDGGSSWTRVYMDSNTIVWSVAMPNGNYGAAIVHHVGNIYNHAPDSLPDDIIVTHDGWKTRTTRALPAGTRACQQLICLKDGTFLTTPYAGVHRAPLLKSVDEGASWTAISQLPLLNDLMFINERLGWAAMTDWSAHPYRALLLKTTDGGVTWNPGFDTSLTTIKATDLGSVSFSDSLHGVAVGDAIIETTDAGKTWSQTEPPIGDPTVYGMGFLSQVISFSPKYSLALYYHFVLRNSGIAALVPPKFLPHKFGPLPIVPTAIEWAPVTGAVKYQLELAMDPPNEGSSQKAFNHPVVDTFLSGTSIQFTPLPAEYYYARVRAINGTDTSNWRQTGDWAQLAAFFYTTAKPGAPLPPTILSPVSGSKAGPNVKFSWTPVAGAESYTLLVDEEGLVIRYLTFSGTEGSDTNLVRGLTYYVQVRANIPNDTTDWSSSNYYFSVPYLSSVGEAAGSNSCRLYPNPARDEVVIEMPRESGDARVRVFDQLGRECTVSQHLSASGITVDTHLLLPGAYEVVLGGKSTRLVVKR